MPVYSEGLQVGPGAGVVLADTGQIALGGEINVSVMITNEAQYPFLLQHRNAANDANVQEIVILEEPYERDSHEFSFTLAVNERIRVITNEAMGGGYQATISVL